MTGLDDHLRRERARRERRGGARVLGAPPRAGTVDLAGNDYLGLSRDPEVLTAAAEALARYGTGTGGSRVVAGNLVLHDELDAALAALVGAPAAVLTSSGYLANLAAVTSLAPADGCVVIDEHAHASLVDGARLAQVPVRWLGHNDADHLDALLARHGRPGALVVVESVYSAMGDSAPLAGLAEVTRRHGATLLVDEAHGVGTVGQGRGGVHAAGLAGAPDVVVTGALGKACAAQGGFVAASGAVVEHLVAAGRSFVYDTALAPASAAAALAAVRRIVRDPGRVAECRAHAVELADALGAPPPAAAIVSAPVAAERADAVLSQARDAGVLLGRFRPGSTPDGRHRLRVTGHAGLSPADRARALAVLRGLDLGAD